MNRASVRHRLRPTRPRDERGAALVEFAIVALLALLPLTLGILQVALLYVGKHTLNHAAFLAARAGAVANADRATLERYLAKGLAPLHAGGRDDITAANVFRAGARAYALAYAEVLRPDQTRLRILNPTADSFADFARIRDGRVEIPLSTGPAGGPAGPRSGQTHADATLLRLRVDYCHPLIVPIVDRLIVALVRRLNADAFAQACNASGRVVLSAHALVQMHSAPRRAAMGPLG